jgi:hypothetical protein
VVAGGATDRADGPLTARRSRQRAILSRLKVAGPGTLCGALSRLPPSKSAKRRFLLRFPSFSGPFRRPSPALSTSTDLARFPHSAPCPTIYPLAGGGGCCSCRSLPPSGIDEASGR